MLRAHALGANATGGLGVNVLLPADFDPYSKQPELKHAAVQVEKYTAGKTLVAMRRSEVDADGRLQPQPLEVLQQLRRWLPHFPYASLTLAGRNAPVVVLKARGEELAPALIEALDRELPLDDPTKVLSYQDSRKDGQARAGRRGFPRGRAPRRRNQSRRLAGRHDGAGSFRGGRAPLAAGPADPAAGRQAARARSSATADVAEDDILAFRGGESLDACCKPAPSAAPTAAPACPSSSA